MTRRQQTLEHADHQWRPGTDLYVTVRRRRTCASCPFSTVPAGPGAGQPGVVSRWILASSRHGQCDAGDMKSRTSGHNAGTGQQCGLFPSGCGTGGTESASVSDAIWYLHHTFQLSWFSVGKSCPCRVTGGASRYVPAETRLAGKAILRTMAEGKSTTTPADGLQWTCSSRTGLTIRPAGSQPADSWKARTVLV